LTVVYIITINGLEHKFNTPQYIDILEKIAKGCINKNPQHWKFHHMSDYDNKHTKELYVTDLNGFPRYDDDAAYGYGFVHRYDGDTTGCHKVMSGMTQKLARQIAGELNNAVAFGYSWAKHVIIHCRKELDFEKCLQENGC